MVWKKGGSTPQKAKRTWSPVKGNPQRSTKTTNREKWRNLAKERRKKHAQ